jgi:hypothetical protein
LSGRKSSTQSARRSSSAEPEVRSCAVVPGTSLSTSDADGCASTHGDHLTQHMSAPEVHLTPDDMNRDFVSNTKMVPADVSDEELEAVLCSIRLARQQQQRRRMSEVTGSTLVAAGTGMVELGALRFEFRFRLSY